MSYGTHSGRYHIQLAGTCAIALLLATAGCTYSTIDVGKGSDISAEQMRAYAYDQSGGNLPVPIEDYPGKGRAVQMDRMITMDISFADPDNNPLSGTSHIQFIHSANRFSLSRYALYTFGYVSQKLLDAMAGMRAGGRRRVQITDFTCENTFQSKFLSEFNGNQCGALGAVRDGPYGARFGGIYYPRGKPVVANIFIAEVCKPWVLRKDRPDIMGGGPSVKLIYMWCR